MMRQMGPSPREIFFTSIDAAIDELLVRLAMLTKMTEKSWAVKECEILYAEGKADHDHPASLQIPP